VAGGEHERRAHSAVWTPAVARGNQPSMADPEPTREILEKLSTATVERGLGALTWTLCEGVFEEYGSPFWHQEKAVTLIHEFTAQDVSPWIGLALMKREASFANKT